MKTLLITLLASLTLISAAPSVQAGIILSLEPGSQTIDQGNLATIDLVVSGLGNLTAPSLGAFDVDLSYSGSILTPVSVSFGTHLDLGVFSSVQSFTFATPGIIHLDEVSLEDPSLLQTTQPSSFRLATLSLQGTGAGVSSLGFSGGSLSDELGNSLSFDTAGGSVEVRGGSGSVPDSGSSAFLLALGALGIVGIKLRRQAVVM